MIKISRAVLGLALLAMFFTQQAAAITVSVNWEKKGGMRASLPRGGSRSFSGSKMKVCSGDRVKFSWSGENMNMWMFASKSEFDSCSKGNLNFLKNPSSSGSFMTKANNSGWRYYAYIPGTDKGDEHGGAGGKSCALKLAVLWADC